MTGILATVCGGSGWTAEQIDSVLELQVRSFRITPAFRSDEANLELIAAIRSRAAAKKIPIDLYYDVSRGTKLRTTNSTPIEFARNDFVTIGHGADFQVEVERPLPSTLSTGSPLYLGDSEVVLRVDEQLDGGYVCIVVDGGVLRTKKGVTTPGVDLGLGTINVENKKDIDAAVADQIECVVLSFVRSAQDVIECRSLVGAGTKIVSKIETLDAIENLEAVVEVSDSVMVARGDLALQAGYERLGVLQWTIIDAALRHDTPFIIATQVFETVIDHIVPSRSDLHDLSCAAAMGAELVMLGPETCMNSENLRAIETASLVLNAVHESGARIQIGNFT